MSIRRPMCVLSLAFMLLTYVLLSILGGVDLNEYSHDYTKVIVSGKIIDKVYKNGKSQIHLKECSIVPENEKNMTNKKLVHTNHKHIRKAILILSEQDLYDFKIGQFIMATGTYSNYSLPENDGQFNSRKYYRIQGYEANIRDAYINYCGNSFSRYREVLFTIKTRTKTLYHEYIDDSDAGTLAAMVLGDKTGLDEEIKDVYQAAGISHILSLSGLHIASVGIFVFSLFCNLGLGRLEGSILSTALMVSYGIMTGMSTSTHRALIMFFLALFSQLIGRTYDLLSGVCFASILIIFENPYYIFDSGYLMSFLSVIGIGMIYPILDDLTDVKVKKRGKLGAIIENVLSSIIYTRLRQSICVSIAATMATLPVVMNSFYKVSRYSVILNLIVVPLMSVVLFLGIGVLIIGNIFYYIKPLYCVVQILLIIADKILEFYSFISSKSATIYGNTWVVGQCEGVRVVCYCILLCSVYVFFDGYKQRCENDIRKGEHDGLIRASMLTILVLAVVVLTHKKLPEFSEYYLSVGQGACNVIHGKKTPTVVVDGGSTDVKNVYKYRIKPFLMSKGIDKIDYMFITHPDEDHISGIVELLEDDLKDIQVRHLFMSVYDEKIEQLTKEREIEYHIMNSGNYIENKSVIIKCINGCADQNVVDINDASLVLKVIYKENGMSTLYTGDISSKVEREICADEDRSREINNTDIISIPHHGSKYSSCEQFIKAVNPHVSVISAGKGNSYGHPHKETLERLYKYAPNSMVLRTDESGQISIISWDGKVTVNKYYRNKERDERN